MTKISTSHKEFKTLSQTCWAIQWRRQPNPPYPLPPPPSQLPTLLSPSFCLCLQLCNTFFFKTKCKHHKQKKPSVLVWKMRIHTLIFHLFSNKPKKNTVKYQCKYFFSHSIIHEQIILDFNSMFYLYRFFRRCKFSAGNEQPPSAREVGD